MITTVELPKAHRTRCSDSFLDVSYHPLHYCPYLFNGGLSTPSTLSCGYFYVHGMAHVQVVFCHEDPLPNGHGCNNPFTQYTPCMQWVVWHWTYGLAESRVWVDLCTAKPETSLSNEIAVMKSLTTNYYFTTFKISGLILAATRPHALASALVWHWSDIVSIRNPIITHKYHAQC